MRTGFVAAGAPLACKMIQAMRDAAARETSADASDPDAVTMRRLRRIGSRREPRGVAPLSPARHA
eukprot:3758131-Prymnesium_polylepis.1